MHGGRAAKPQPLGDKPLAVIIPGRRDGPPAGVNAEEWAKLMEEKVRQKEGLAGLSRNSRVVRAPRSGHHIQLDEPAAVVGAIREVVEAARTGGRVDRAAVGKRPAGDGPRAAAGGYHGHREPRRAAPLSRIEAGEKEEAARFVAGLASRALLVDPTPGDEEAFRVIARWAP
jgi:hypothetical protein